MVVQIAVPHASAVENHRMIEDRAVALARCLQLLEEVPEQLHVVGVDLLLLRHQHRIVPMMRHGMVLLGHADLRVRAPARFAGHEQRKHASDVRLEGERLQIEHELGVLVEVLRNVGRPIRERQLRGRPLGLRALDPLLHLTDRLQVLAKLRSIPCAQTPLQTGDFLDERIEQAAGLPRLREPIRRAAALPEQALEHHPRMRLHRVRRRRGPPGDRVREEAVGAVARDLRRLLQHDLERRQLRLATEVLRGHLIDGRAEHHRRPAPSPLAVPRVHAAQPDGRAARMVAVAVAERIGLPMRQPAEHEQLIAHRRERAQNRRQLEAGAHCFGNERVLDDAVRRAVDEADPPRRGDLRGGGQRRHHRIQQGERQRGAHAAQKGPPRQ